LPAPAWEGSNIPTFGSVIPCPDQTPPGIEALRIIGVEFKHKDDTGVILTGINSSTVIVISSVSEQAPLVTVYEI